MNTDKFEQALSVVGTVFLFISAIAFLVGLTIGVLALAKADPIHTILPACLCAFIAFGVLGLKCLLR